MVCVPVAGEHVLSRRGVVLVDEFVVQIQGLGGGDGAVDHAIGDGDNAGVVAGG